MKDYKIQDNALNNKASTLLDRMLVEHKRLKIERFTDVPFCRNIDYLTSEVEKVKLLINENPRFQWVIIQKEMDRLFSTDKNINGIILKLSWKEGEKWGSINGKIEKA